MKPNHNGSGCVSFESRMSLISVMLTCSVVCAEGARILAVFPFPSLSHQLVFRPLTQELARRGHEVLVLTTDPAFPKGQAPHNLTEIDVHNISYEIWLQSRATDGNEDTVTQTMMHQDLILPVLQKQILSNEVQSMINKKSFDLILTQSVVRPALSFSFIYKVPVILVSSLGGVYDDYDTMGASSHPILYPTFVAQRLYNLTFWEKLVNVYNNIRLNYLYDAHKDKENEMFKKVFGAEAPTVDELKKNINLLCLNVHPMWNGNVPVPPAVVYMGGIHLKPDKPLPEDLQSYLDSSKHGVIYVSFGSNIKPSSLPSETIRTFIKVFTHLPYDVLWKWDKDELPGRTHNIKIGKWWPQSDLLKHPKVKLFITQGGLQSTDEAISAGVPLIGVPMRIDQWYNVEKYVFHRIGLRLDLGSITEHNLRTSINTVISEPSYKQSIIRVRTLVCCARESALQRAVRWTEHVARVGGEHLRSPAANVSATQYFQIDLQLIVFSILFTFLLFLYLTFRFVWSFFRQRL